MRIKVREGSDYLRGLLVLAGRDRRVAAPEAGLVKRAGRALGFESGFCADAIREILNNSHIAGAPPRFASRALTERFVRDGLALASSDHEVHRSEDRWLRATVAMNGLDREWYRAERAKAAGGRPSPARLEVEGLTVEYC